MTRLAAYLQRIGYDGATAPDFATLVGVHRAHLLAIPYENIDVALRRPLTRDPAAAFDKIVARRRGGWCYEMNGLLAWALEEIGFDVTRLAGAVRRADFGDATRGNHLVLRVDLDRPYIADAGFGDGLLEPIPLAEGRYTQRGLTYRLEKLDARWWRFHNHEFGSASSFDFIDAPGDPALLDRQCLNLQADGSRFVASVILQRHTAEGLAILRDRTLKVLAGGRLETRELADPEAYRASLGRDFALPTDDADLLWRKLAPPPERSGVGIGQP